MAIFKTSNQDINLNLAPVIDCFTVLILFMLLSASFLATGIISSGAQIEEPQKVGSATSQEQIEVNLLSSNELEVVNKGKQKFSKRIPSRMGKYDFAGLEGLLGEMKAKNPNVSALTVIAANDVEYASVIGVMASARKVIPSIFLGGL